MLIIPRPAAHGYVTEDGRRVILASPSEYPDDLPQYVATKQWVLLSHDGKVLGHTSLLSQLKMKYDLGPAMTLEDYLNLQAGL